MVYYKLLFFILLTLSNYSVSKHLIDDISLLSNTEYHNMVVEIPAGTNEKWELNKKTGINELEMKKGKPRIIEFLPYPGNYGFLPQTLSGDNDPLDIILLSSSIKRDSVVEVIIIGSLMFEDKGEEDFKLIAIPTDEEEISIEEYMLKKPNAVLITKLWFESYKKPGKMVFKGYLNRKDTLVYIDSNHLRWKKSNSKKK